MTTRSWIRSVCSHSVSRRPIRGAPSRARLGVVGLEDRWVPSTFTVLNTDDVNFINPPVNSGPGSVGVVPDNDPEGLNLTVVTSGYIGVAADINVNFDATMTYDSDIVAILEAPNGTSITLFAFVGGSDDNFTGTILDDQATISIAAGAAPFTGSFKPAQPLASFNGLTGSDLNGTWTLHLVDRFGQDIMTVNSWSLDISVGDVSVGSLRDCINQANSNVGADTINFDSGVFSTPQTITLTNGQLTLTDATGATSITGPAAGVTVSGGGLSRVFQVDPLVTASISGLTITGGNVGFDSGGGLYNGGTTTLTNCTISGNSGGFGGGLAAGSYFNQGTSTTLTNCTISGNSGFVELYVNFGTATMTNTIVVGESSVIGAVSGSNNLIGLGGSGGLINGVGGNIVGVANPGLAPLGSYGGTSQSMALLPGSPAINAGASGAGIPATDQRGLSRVGAVDIGVFESQGFTLTPVPGSTPQSSRIGTAFANPLAVTVTANNPIEPINGGVVSFVGNRVNGATAMLLGPSSVVIEGGQAEVAAAPNNAVGSYTVVAFATGSSPASFALTNVGSAFASLVVNTTSDLLFPGAGLLSLREAVAFANFDSAGISTITFNSGVFSTPQVITLTGSQLELSNTSETVTITGPAARVTIDGGGLSRVFQVDALVTASISGLTIAGGNAGPDGDGGGVLNLGTATLTNCTVSGNSTPFDFGGGLWNSGTATLTNCAVSGNSALFGGGLFNRGTAILTNSTVSGNSALFNGGGVGNNGAVTLTNCTISGNSAGSAGGLFNSGYTGTATLTNCTISGNSADSAGGVLNLSYFGARTTLTNTIVAGQTAGGDIVGGVSGSNNLIGAGGSGGLLDGVDGNIVGVANPGLGLLGNYGGTTQTMPLLPGSPAINVGTGGPGIPGTDQRGLNRFGGTDIGAFESQGFAFTPVPGSTPQSSRIGTAFANPLAVTVTANDPIEPVDGGVVSFVANRVNGATAMLLGPSAVVIGGGQAAVAAAPNNAVGSYTVVASITGLSPAISFALTNIGPVFSRLVVNTTSDSLLPGAGLLSLREAIAFANFDSLGNSTITFDSGSGRLFRTPRTITLTGSQLELSNLTERVTITGPSARVTVDGGGLSRVFQVDEQVRASISGLTITGGNAGSDGNGGGLLNLGTTTLTNCTVSDSSADFGGGVWNSGTATLINCTVNGNSGTFFGGGLFNSDGTTTLTNCTVSGNTAGFGGGGVLNLGTTSLTNCTVSGNTAGFAGGGLSNYGTTTSLTNCTVSDNTASFSGGGLFSDNGTTTTLTNCTVSGNTASFSGGGLFSNNGTTTTLTNCTVSGNTAGNRGGGLTNEGTATLTNCTVRGNTAGSSDFSGYGGGLQNTGTITVTNCTISANTAAGCAGGGGGMESRFGITTLTNCTIRGNSAGFNGGGLVNYGGNTTLRNCTISGNSSAGAGGGVGNSSYYGTTTLTNCTVAGNSAVVGGGIWNAGTLIVASSNINNNRATSMGAGISTTSGSATLTNTDIKENEVNSSSSALGGGIHCENSVLSLTNCKVNDNEAEGATALGGGIYVFNSTLAVQSCTINTNRANGATAQGGGVYARGSTVDVRNSKVNGNRANGSVLGEGGGVYSLDSVLTLLASIVNGNHASTGFDNIFVGP